MKRTAVVMYLLFILFSHFTWGKCSELKKEIEVMAKAHRQLLTSMITNQDTTINELEGLGKEAELNQGYLDSKKIIAIKEDAIYLKTRNRKSEKLLQKLDLASDLLLSKLATCLK